MTLRQRLAKALAGMTIARLSAVVGLAGCTVGIPLAVLQLMDYCGDPQPSVIEGMVTLDGHPVPDAHVQSSAQNVAPPTNSTGRFRLTIAETEAFPLLLSVTHSALTGQKPWDSTLAQMPGAPLKIGLHSARSAVLAGRVTDVETEEPIRGAVVTVTVGASGTAESDSNGNFAVHLAAAPYSRVEVRVTHPDYEPRTCGKAIARDIPIRLRRRQH